MKKADVSKLLLRIQVCIQAELQLVYMIWLGLLLIVAEYMTIIAFLLRHPDMTTCHQDGAFNGISKETKQPRAAVFCHPLAIAVFSR